MQRVFRPQLILAAALIGLAVAGCSVKHPTANLVRGKQLFVAKCGACHTLSHAQATGNIGPNLDAAFGQALHDGMRRDDIRGVVDFQIKYPNPYGGMPAMLFKGQCATDVAAYVAAVAAAPGSTDSAPLATATQIPRPAECGLPAAQPVAQKPVTEQAGKLEIDADPTGLLKFLASSATATPGPATLRMVNKSSVPHDIAIEGGGLNQVGPVVSGGGVSTVSVTLKPGKYTFYCSVPGHREAGMVGTITVK